MTEALVVTVEAELAATPAEVFKAWTEPEQLMQWWGNGEEMTAGVVEVDLRVGGRYRLGMKNADGEEYVVSGEYTEVSPPSKLGYTWRWEHSAAEFPTGEIEVLFRETEKGCHVAVTHRRLPDKDQAEKHHDGWQKCVTSLGRFLAA